MARRFRILIADNHLLVAEAYQKLLGSEYEVVGVVTDGRALLDAATELRPDLILAEIAMPGLNGLDACEQIKNKHKTIRVVFVTMTARPEAAAEAFRRGASGFVPKYSTASDLCAAVRIVLRGESYLSPLITRDTVTFLLRTNPAASMSKTITPRQREVLQLLAEGGSMKEVAYTLKVNAGTVAFHKYKMMETLGIKTNAELIQYAYCHQIAPH